MKCRKCDNTAQINMRQHKLALCRDHYLEWLPEQTERFIQRYDMFTQDEKILVAVSGGKDSLVLWDVLVKLGYQAAGFVEVIEGLSEGEMVVTSAQFLIDSEASLQEAVQKLLAQRRAEAGPAAAQEEMAAPPGADHSGH